MNKTKKLSPVHPGEILQYDFLGPMKLSQNKLALEIKVPARRINEIVLGKRGITADTALRLSIFFRTTPELWLNLQNQYEIDLARIKEEEELRQTIRPFRAA